MLELDEIAALAKEISDRAQEYYEGHPTISDESFDLLVEKLSELDPENSVLHKVGWGFQIKCDLDKEVKHQFPVAKFESKVKKAENIPGYGPLEAEVTPKLDGGSICCYYFGGKLGHALTRGDGITGIDVTDKLKYLVPQELKIDKSFTGLVRGEITMTNQTFEKKYAQSYVSNRNLCVGMIMRKEISFDDLMNLEFVGYTVRGTNQFFGQTICTHCQVLNWLYNNGFNCVTLMPYRLNRSDDHPYGVWSDEALVEIIKSYTEYPIDGVVITSKEFEQLEDGTFVPEYEVAYKIPAESKLVTVKDVKWNFTRTGRLNPVVVYDPVKLSGAFLERATAFNVEYVRENKLGPGSKILISRSGEVIPDIQEVVTPSDKMNIPEVCPECGAPLVTDGAYLVCENKDCSGQSYENLYRWLSVIGGVKGVGLSIKSMILESLEDKSIDGLYYEIDQIHDRVRSMKGMGPNKLVLVDKVIQKLQSPVSMEYFMAACNLSGCGWETAWNLNSQYDLILNDPIDRTWYEKLDGLSGVSVTAKRSIQENIYTIRRYASYVQIYQESESDNEVELIPIAVTGKISVPRAVFFEEMKKYGFCEGSINQATYLITDNPNSGSNKLKKARQKGIEVISESDFRELVATKG